MCSKVDYILKEVFEILQRYPAPEKLHWFSSFFYLKQEKDDHFCDIKHSVQYAWKVQMTLQDIITLIRCGKVRRKYC